MHGEPEAVDAIEASDTEASPKVKRRRSHKQVAVNKQQRGLALRRSNTWSIDELRSRVGSSCEAAKARRGTAEHGTAEGQNLAEDRWWQGVEHLMMSSQGGTDTTLGIDYMQGEWRGKPLIGSCVQGIWSDCES